MATQAQYDAALKVAQARADKAIADHVPGMFKMQAEDALHRMLPEVVRAAVDAALAVK